MNFHFCRLRMFCRLLLYMSRTRLRFYQLDSAYVYGSSNLSPLRLISSWFRSLYLFTAEIANWPHLRPHEAAPSGEWGRPWSEGWLTDDADLAPVSQSDERISFKSCSWWALISLTGWLFDKLPASACWHVVFCFWFFITNRKMTWFMGSGPIFDRTCQVALKIKIKTLFIIYYLTVRFSVASLTRIAIR